MVPHLTLAYVVPIVVAFGVMIWEWLQPAQNNSWKDKTVFNDRMRSMQSSVGLLNTAFSQCQSFMNDKAKLTAWKTFRDLWSKYYAEVGKLEFSSPSEEQIHNLKDYASKIVQWVDTLKSFKECADFAKSPSSVPNYTPLPSSGRIPWWTIPAGLLTVFFLFTSRKR